MQSQFPATYKYLYTFNYRSPWGWGYRWCEAPNNSCINLLFTFVCFHCVQGSMGAIFAVMKLKSSPCGVHYRERASAHPHCSPANWDLQTQRDGLVWWEERREPTERSEGVAGGGYSGEARRKKTINTQLMTSNKLTTQQKLMEWQKLRDSLLEQMA